MEDVFIEKIISKRKSIKDHILIVSACLIALLIIVLFLFLAKEFIFLFPLVIAALVYALWQVFTNLNIEYEYIVTNGELDIDIIVAKRKRKRALTVKAKDFELMTPYSEHEQATHRNLKVLDYTSRSGITDTWLILTTYKQEKIKILFEPDQRMLKNLKRYNPSKINYQR